MLWVKSFHIVFVASWFAGLFYLPRIFVNLAMVPVGSVAERDRLLLMAKKLLRFTSILAVPALALGLWLWLVYGILARFEDHRNTHSHIWWRWYNELPVLLLVAAVVLVVVKPW
jgi:putative membrane protein